MDKIFLTKKTIYIIIILSAILSLFISKNYLNKYDTSENKTYYQKVEHPMIKAAIINHWFEADEIIKDIKKGKNFFVSGSDYDEFLPQRLLALYYLLQQQ